MKLTPLTILLILSSILGCQPALASPKVYGEGNESCGQWLEARKGNRITELAISAWVRGYLSAYEEQRWVLAAPEAAKVDSDAISGWLDLYCREHPLDAIAFRSHTAESQTRGSRSATS